jgi:hypothetical protein
MTRINAGIPPQKLTNRHLLAEHREIKRIPNVIKNGKAKLENIPKQFSLGKGHVKFFYNKLGYLHARYVEIRTECEARGFNITDYENAFLGLPDDLYGTWEPRTEDIRIIEERIKSREDMAQAKARKEEGETAEGGGTRRKARS